MAKMKDRGDPTPPVLASLSRSLAPNTPLSLSLALNASLSRSRFERLSLSLALSLPPFTPRATNPPALCHVTDTLAEIQHRNDSAGVPRQTLYL